MKKNLKTLRYAASMIIAASFVTLMAASAPSCTVSEDCRFEPSQCGGDVGGNCSSDADCIDGYCCTDKANCGGGMCTLSCANNLDCPEFMACEHQKCFFRCETDADCAAGQKCEHGNTVCEWP